MTAKHNITNYRITRNFKYLTPLYFPGLSIRILVLIERGIFHLDGVSRHQRRRVITTIDDFHRLHKMLVQVVDILANPALQAGIHRDVAKDGQVLNVLAQTHSPGMRADPHPELRGHEKDGQNLVNSSYPAGVHLKNGKGLGL